MGADQIECLLTLEHDDFIMQNHRVHGVSVMPGVTFLDVILRIVAARGLDAERVVLRNVLFAEAVATAPGRNREIRVTINGDIEAGTAAVVAESRVAGGAADAPWQRNCSAELTLDDQPDPPSADLGALRSGARREDMDALYARARAENIRHGPAMTCSGPVYRGEDCLLAELDVAEPVSSRDEQFYLHPARLDATTIAAFVLTEPAGDPFIPMFIERFRAPRPLSGRWYVHVPAPETLSESGEVMRNSCRVYDDHGGFAEFTNLTCKRIRFPELITRLVTSAEPVPPAPGSETAAGADERSVSQKPADGGPGAYSAAIRSLVAGLLGREAAAVSTGTGFYDLGLDSMAVLQISARLEELVGKQLYPTLLFEFSTIESLSSHLASTYGAPTLPEETGPVTARESTARDTGPATPAEPARRTFSCYQPAWVTRDPVPAVPAPGALIVVGGSPELLAVLRARIDGAVAHVTPGAGFGRTGPDSYLLNVTDRTQVGQLLEELAVRHGRPPRCLLRVADDADEGVPAGEEFLTLWSLAAELVERRPDGPCQIAWLYPSRPGEARPAHAALGALARTIAAETPAIRVQVVEYAADASAPAVATMAVTELAGPGGEEIRYRAGHRQVLRHVPYEPPRDAPATGGDAGFQEGKAYLVAGGEGAIASTLVGHLLRDVRARVALLGHGAPRPATLASIAKWRAEGADVHYVSADLADAAEVKAAVAQARDVLGGLDGVIHCAGTVNDGVYFRKNPSQIRRVLEPKLLGARHLDDATRSDRLSLFVMFGSLSAVIANSGQCDYAYANAYLSHFARWRAGAVRPGRTLTIDWPYWADGGMRVPPEFLERAERETGLGQLPTADGLGILRRCLAGPGEQLTVAYGDPSRFAAVLRPVEPAAAAADPVPAADTAAAGGPAPSAPSAEAGELSDVAIIGVAGRYPKARDLREFWANLVEGRDCVTEVPADRWDHEEIYDPEHGTPGRTYGKWGGFLSGADRFDPAFFGISRREAERMDPQERLFLQTCWHALEDAGYHPGSLAGEPVGVFAGVMWNHYQLLVDPREGVAPTALHTAVPNRVSFTFGLTGPSLAVDTACSSSLTAVHLAVESLRRGECDVALAGGVNVMTHPQKYLQLAQGAFLADDGRCRSFGEGGSGYVPGEGVGALLLKPLRRAQADGDRVYAVIKASFLNHSGRTSGFIVPSPAAQGSLIRSALRRSGLSPATIGYVEAHGTGTSLGDPIEVEGLRKGFADAELQPGACAIGSVKSNIGHLESAAGIAGLTKVLLQFEHQELVPSLHADTLNPGIDFESSPFVVQRARAPWPRPAGGARRAGVSAFGAGGANAHVVLEDFEASRPESHWRGPCLFVLSARTSEALRAYAESVAVFLERRDRPASRDVRAQLGTLLASVLGISASALDERDPLEALGLDAELVVRLVERLDGVRAQEVLPGLGLDISLAAFAERCTAAADGDTPGAVSVDLDDLAYTSQVGRAPMAHRLAVVTENVAALRESLARFASGADPGEGEFWGGRATTRPRLDVDHPQAFREGRLADLAQLWADGTDVAWRDLYPRDGIAHPPRRVSMPGYPFQEERCWLGGWHQALPAAPARGPETPVPETTVLETPVPETTGPEIDLRIVADHIALVVMRAAMFTDGLLEGLTRIFGEIGSRDDVAAVVITGVDGVFSMGGTQAALERLAAGHGRFTDASALYEVILRCDRPVIAAMQGHASGGGLAFGLHADLVVMSSEALYSANFLAYGFTPGMGATSVLERHFGRALAADMMYTGRSFRGDELRARGAAVQVVSAADVLSAALAAAQAVAGKPARAVRTLKSELARRAAAELEPVIAREVAMHEEVLGPDALRLVSEHFGKVDGFTAGRPRPRPAPGQPAAPAPRPLAEPASAAAASAEPGDPRTVVEEVLGQTLYLHPEEIDPQSTFNELGLDSVGAVQVSRELSRRFDVELDSVIVYDHPTVAALAQAIAEASAQARRRRSEAVSAVTTQRPVLEPLAPEPPAPPTRVALPPVPATAPGRGAAAPAARGRGITLAPVPLGPARDDPAPLAGRPHTGARHGTGGHTGDIAVIGMSGRFPDAPDLAAFWENLASGRCSMTEVPPSRWNPAEWFDPDREVPGRTYSKWVAALDDVEGFDAAFFNLSPLEAEVMDPQQRLFLQEAWRGLESAGYAVGPASRLNCGVFVGCGVGDYQDLLAADEADSGHAFLGNSSSILAARIAYFLNLDGPTMAIDTACSSSLAAVHLACQSIRSGECEMAVAGGVAIMLTPKLHIRTSKTGMLSPTGTCAPFDASADGIVLGEGVGAVVLKDLGRAVADGDHIHGVIRGTGLNGDGKTNGITAPSASSQAGLLARVHEEARVGQQEIGYVEAHGTGTPLGDPIEVKALKQVFAGCEGRPASCGLGSVKANIGHTTMAAGIAGLLKVLLALRHHQIPPTAGWASMNPKIDLGGSPFFIPDSLTEWPENANGTRIGVVSSFGFSGTNCHVVVASAPEPPERAPWANGEPVLVPVSARTPDALKATLSRLVPELRDGPDLRDVALTLGLGRSHMAHREVFEARTTAELAARVDEVLTGDGRPDLGSERPAPGRLAAAFKAGETLDWQSLVGGLGGRRIPLPTYPFAPRRYWPDRVKGDTELDVTVRPDDWLVDHHRVAGERVLPGAACVDLALAAARDLGLGRPSGLEAVRWLRPFAADTAATLRLRFRPDEEGRLAFEIQDGQTGYACGRLLPDSRPAAEGKRLDLDAIRKRCPELRPGPSVYRDFGAVGIEYGAAYQLLAEVAIGRDEALGMLEVPEQAVPGWPSHVVHPALLDAALQATAVLLPGNGAAVPFALDGVTAVGTPRGTARVHVTRKDAERFAVTVTDEDGTVMIEARGFTVRALRDPVDTMMYRPLWRAAPLGPAAVAAAPRRVAVVHTGPAVPLARALASRHPGAEVQLARADDLGALSFPYDLVYFLALGDRDQPAEDDRSALGLFRLDRQARAAGMTSSPMVLKIVTASAVRAAGDDSILPHTAGVFGLARAIEAERPRWSVGCLDVSLDQDLPDLAARIAEEDLAWPLVALRPGRRLIRGFEAITLPASVSRTPFRQEGAYLIIGGAGGIGFELSRHLARNAAARLVWVGRSPVDETIDGRRAAIEELGGQVLYVQADVTDEASVSGAIAAARTRFGPLHGAFHSALVLHDRTLANLDEPDFTRVLAPKVTGAAVLGRVLAGQPLDFLVFFSSAASFTEASGQGNYAAASTFEDAYAEYLRQESGHPVSVVNWGYWGSIGVVSQPGHRRRLASLGIGSVEPAAGFEVLTRVLAAGLPQALVIKATPDALTQFGVTAPSVPAGLGIALDRARQAFTELDRLARALTRRALADVSGDVPARQRRLLNAVTGVAEQAEPDGGAGELLLRHPEMAPHVRLLNRCVDALPEVLAGRRDPLGVLFPAGSVSMVEDVYRGQPISDYHNRLLAQEAAAAVRRVAADGRPARIIEIGAGTGATSAEVLAACADTGLKLEYHYTDMSVAFLNHGQSAFAERYPFASFRIFDVETDPAEQGLPVGTYDVVIAANVLHATRTLGGTLSHVSALLRPGGQLLVNEVSRFSDFLTVTFGLTPGWWAYQDDGARIPNAPLLSPGQWRDALNAAGFGPVEIRGVPGLAEADLGQVLAVARRPGGNRAAEPAPDGADRAAGTATASDVCRYLKSVFAEVLKYDEADLDHRATFETFGVDSLISLSLISRMERDVGELPATVLFEHLTIEQLAGYLLERDPARMAEVTGARPETDSVPEPAAEPGRDIPSSAATGDDIAIIGVSGRYPGSPDLDAFWGNLAAGRECVSTVPADRWDWRTHFDAEPGTAQRTYSRWAGFIDGVDMFDPAPFGVLPREALYMDPQERLFLETSWNLLEEAGYLGARTREPNTGVFAGVMYGTYGQIGATRWARGELSGAHSAHWSVANRVSYSFDFNGPSFAVDSACSSSLTAVHLACESLRRGECAMAIAGGVNVILHPAHLVSLCSMNMLSADGHCKTFDATADGFVPGEGVGAVLLKPLDQAVVDGDRVWAVIKGGAMNAGGKTAGYTVPNPNAQAAVVASAMRRSGVDPRTVTYLEAHGTGTSLGDPIEVAGLARAFGAAAGPDGPGCAIGSVKANIGHLESAAGIAGLTKVLLQMRHGELVPAVNLTDVNPKINFAATRFAPVRTRRPWDRVAAGAGGAARTIPRRAGVSSFGAGGANVHLVLEESPVGDEDNVTESEGRGEQVFILSANSRDQLAEYARQVADYLGDRGRGASLAGLAYTSQVGRREMAERLAIIATDTAQLAARLATFAGGQDVDGAYSGRARGGSGAGADPALSSAGLAQAWVQGAEVDWLARRPGPARPRVTYFPTYPFARRRFWISPAADALPPGATVPTRPETPECLERSLTAGCVTQHRVNGARWVPGAAYLTLARAALPGQACELRDVRWPRPLNLDQTPGRVVLTLDRDGEPLRFQVGDAADGAVYARGLLAPAAGTTGAAVDIEAARSRCADSADIERFYGEMRSAGLEHGPGLRVISQLWLGEHEALAFLERNDDPAAGDPEGLEGTALLDGALQTLAALGGDGGSAVPTGAAAVRWHAPLGARCWAHAREVSSEVPGARKFDVDLTADDGTVLVAITGLATDPLPSAEPSCRYYRPRWEHAPVPDGTRPTRRVLAVVPDAPVREALVRELSAAGASVALPGDLTQAEQMDLDAIVVVAPGARPDTRPGDGLDSGFYALFDTVAPRLAVGGKSALRVIFAHGGDGRPQPEHAAVGAALRTLALEHSQLSAARVSFDDAGASADPATLARHLVTELRADGTGAADIRYRGGVRWSKSLEDFSPPAQEPRRQLVRPGGTYLITGGAGALGRRFADHLLALGAGTVVLVGRAELDPDREAEIAGLRGPGGNARYLRADVTNAQDVGRLIADIRERHGSLHGLIHAAGVHRDKRASQKTRQEIAEVIAPKVDGTVLLDEATCDEPLDFFALFSSVAGETGNLGQVDYAYANAFLNEYAEAREQLRMAGSRTGRTVSIGWPLWRDGGMTVSEATTRLFERHWNMVPLSTENGLTAFGAALAGPDASLLVVQTAPRSSAAERATRKPPAAAQTGTGEPDTGQVQRELQSLACHFLLVGPDDVDPHTELMDLGFDSISLTELINQVNDRYGLDLLPTVLFECPTLADFAGYLVSNELTVTRSPSGAARVPAETPAPEAAPAPCRDVAIIGMAGAMPGSEDLDAFWEHLRAGTDLVGPVPEDRADLLADPETRDLRAGFVGSVAAFDAPLFNISPREAALMDPQQRLFLQLAWRAVEDAGYRPSSLAGTATGLFAGVATSDYEELMTRHGVPVQAHMATGISHAVLANRVSHLLDLRGPSEAIDTACSSALVAVHRAVNALAAGECDLAIAGAVNVILSPGLFTAFAKSRMLSPDGRCKTFAADADGYARGEGGGALLLKPLRAAIGDGDHIHAVIKGSAVNHCGRSASLTAPNPDAQASVLAQAYRVADVSPASITYLEAHGTGTRLGDPVEIEGMKSAFAQLYAERGLPEPVSPHVAVGAVKTSTGHLEAASGMAGLLKVLLSMRHGELPANLHFRQVNPHIRLDGTPFRLALQRQPWEGAPDGQGRPVRRAGVSSFGFGGTNAHLVLEDFRPSAADDGDPAAERRAWVVPLSAPSHDALSAYADRLADFLDHRPNVCLDRVAATLQCGREPLRERLAVVAESVAELAAALRAAARGQRAPGLYLGTAGRSGPCGETAVHEVARDWVAGAAVDWERRQPQPRPPRMPLPSFPFATTTYWFDTAKKTNLQSAACAPEEAAVQEGADIKFPARKSVRKPAIRLSRTTNDATPAAAAMPDAASGLAPATKPASATGLAPVTRSALGAKPIADAIRRRLANVLGMSGDEIRVEEPFAHYGLDSIMRMDLARELSDDYGLEIKATDLYDHDSLEQLAGFLAVSLTGDTVSAEPVTAPRAEPETTPAGTAEPTPGEPDPDMAELLAQTVAELLGRDLNRSISFQDNGLSSFDMLKVVNALEYQVGALRKTLLFDQPTVAELAVYLTGERGVTAEDLCLVGQLDSEPAVTSAQLLPGGAQVIRRDDLGRYPELAGKVTALDRVHGTENGLPGRDIAPFIFLGSAQHGYFNFGRRHDAIFTWTYTGPEDYFTELACEYVDYASREGLQPALLSLFPLGDVDGRSFSSTPFGALQRITSIEDFTLEGTRMRRLRSAVQKFTKSGVSRTVEYRVGSDPGVDGEIADMIDRWAMAKDMVNPYVGRVKKEIRAGQLADRHRMFVTYLNGALANAIIITEMAALNGYLLDLEFYPGDVDSGGMEASIVAIFDTLREEGRSTFSFGASFGALIGESADAATDVQEAIEDLRSVGIFTGEGNYRFKNKFRPWNIPIYLCQPTDGPQARISDIIMMIASPSAARETAVSPAASPAVSPVPVPAPSPAAEIRETPASSLRNPGRRSPASPEPTVVTVAPETMRGREKVLADHGYNPLALPPGDVDFDLLTDSWAEQDLPCVRERMGALLDGPPAELAGQTTLPFSWAFPAGSGRAAEALLCRTWPNRKPVVLHHDVFPSWSANLLECGFTPTRLPGGLADDGPWARIDVAQLERMLSERTGRVAFLCVEASNNAWGGRPLSMANLRETRDLAHQHGVPLVMDAARVLQNAYQIIAYEEGYAGADVWDVAGQMLSLADSATMSMSKDFGLNFGGLLLTNDDEFAHYAAERIAVRGQEVGLSGRRLLRRALDDRVGVARNVRDRMRAVTILHDALAGAGVPVWSPETGHCVVLDVGRIRLLQGLRDPLRSCLAWMYRDTGVRAAPHLTHEAADASRYVRLAVPVGLPPGDAEMIAARLAELFTSGDEIPDLEPASAAGGAPAPSAFRLAGIVRRDTTGNRAAQEDPVTPPQNPREQQDTSVILRVLREYQPAVQRRCVQLPGGTAEAFVAGTGPTLVMMHPFNIGAGIFARQFEGLTSQFRLVTVHNPGVGATTAADDITLAGIAEQTMEVLRRLDLAGPVHVLGTSFGGLAAQAFALRFPREVKSLTLVGSSFRLGNRVGPISRLALVAKEDFDHVIRNTGADDLRRDRGRFEQLVLDCESMEPRIGLRYLDEFAEDPSLLARLPDIEPPALVVQGRHDSIIPVKTAHMLHGAIPDARYVEMVDAGHFPYLTSPEEFNATLLDFLGTCDAKDGTDA